MFATQEAIYCCSLAEVDDTQGEQDFPIQKHAKSSPVPLSGGPKSRDSEILGVVSNLGTGIVNASLNDSTDVLPASPWSFAFATLSGSGSSCCVLAGALSKTLVFLVFVFDRSFGLAVELPYGLILFPSCFVLFFGWIELNAN